MTAEPEPERQSEPEREPERELEAESDAAMPRFDPRYDPAFQPGYDPRRHARFSERFRREHAPLQRDAVSEQDGTASEAPEKTTGSARARRTDQGLRTGIRMPPSGSWTGAVGTPALRGQPRTEGDRTGQSREYVPGNTAASDLEDALDIDDRFEDAGPAADDDGADRRNPFLVALLVFGVALIAAVIAAYWFSSRAEDIGPRPSQPVLYSIVQTLGTPALVAGILAIVGLLFLLEIGVAGVRVRAAGWRGRFPGVPGAQDSVSRLEPGGVSGETPSAAGRPALIWAILALGVLLTVGGVIAQSVASAMSAANRVGDVLVFRDAIFLALVVGPALVPTGMVTLLALVIAGAVHWARMRADSSRSFVFVAGAAPEPTDPELGARSAEPPATQSASDPVWLAGEETAQPSPPSVEASPRNPPVSTLSVNPFVRALWVVSVICAGAGILVVAAAATEISGTFFPVFTSANQILATLAAISPAVVFVALLAIVGLLLFRATFWTPGNPPRPAGQPTFTDSDDASAWN